MQRVLVVGPCGAGKSTLAFDLAKRLKLPLHHMDRLNWKPGWVESGKEEIRDKLRSIVARDHWLIEGTYGGTLPDRLPRADTVIYLDYPISLCLTRILRRIVHYRGKARPDMTEDCPERLDLGFLWYVVRWNAGPRIRLEAALAPYSEKIIRLPNPRETQIWLDSLPAN